MNQVLGDPTDACRAVQRTTTTKLAANFALAASKVLSIPSASATARAEVPAAAAALPAAALLAMYSALAFTVEATNAGGAAADALDGVSATAKSAVDRARPRRVKRHWSSSRPRSSRRRSLPTDQRSAWAASSRVRPSK